ncbi:MAG: peptidylprolyl isomerase [Lachnospiraceae bacterium]|nr:peptidylprolyl isomerase [Lachnospiraceae bacterium]
MASGNKKNHKNKKQQQNTRAMKILLAIACCVTVIGVVGIIVTTILENRNTVSTGSAETKELAASADDLHVTDYAVIEIEKYGTIRVALDADIAPITVANFKKLAEAGFYNGLTFHRIMDGFMMQGGDPNGDGTGGSDEKIKGEFSANGVENRISHVRGAISMARSSANDSASSQFFIVQSDSTFLDGQYAGFGFVTEGMDIVDQICKDAKPTDGNGSIASDAQPVIKTVTIEAAE